MKVNVKTFGELSTTELYALLQLRSEVFVVEQDCVYQDLDGKDDRAYHVLGWEQDDLAAYTRVFGPGDYFESASIGRVVVRETYRKYGLGREIMKASIEFIEKQLEQQTIALSAQTYLKKFYGSLGFGETGEEYVEDGIPHVKMVKGFRYPPKKEDYS